MKTDQASEHLQTIRTLMERSALYRRELAPIMLFAGTLGVIAAIVGVRLEMVAIKPFGYLWLATAVLAISGAFLIARRQAFKDHENFWSPPTRRVAHALLPPLAAGLGMGIVLMLVAGTAAFTSLLACTWVAFYGCALHAAGFFMSRGVRLFGWCFIAGGCGAMLVGSFISGINPHFIMGGFFGGLQLAYGIYLYLTGKRKKST